MSKKAALLIGNGINRATSELAWSDLLAKLRERLLEGEAQACDNFPQEFQRIYFKSAEKDRNVTHYCLKKIIAESIPVISNLDLHRLFTRSGVEHIMTTNYDYNLEISLDANFSRKGHSSNTTEIKHSLLRHLNLDSVNFWHIHGEQHCPNSICLGYEQYCAYLSKMLEYLTSQKRNYENILSGFNLKPYLMDVEPCSPIPSWLFLFFTHDIYIIGLSLDFIEIDLWWLLNYRHYIQLTYPHLGINNDIYYYYKNPCSASEKKYLKGKLSLLDSMKISLKPIVLKNNGWPLFYEEIYRQIACG